MERLMKQLVRNQSGQSALVMVLILLVVGALVLGPLLGFMGTGLKAGQMHEEKTLGLYAADSGVEDAIFWLPELQENDGSAGPYTYWTRNTTYEMNDRDVDVTVEDVGNQTYKITSTATSGDGGSTTIESYVTTLRMDFSELLMSAISSNGDVTIKPGVDITGNVTASGTVDNKGTVNGTITDDTTLNWPTAENLSAFYWDDVEDLESPFPYNHPMDIAGTNTTIEALYRDGPLDIYNSSNTPATLTLNGTAYFTGDLKVGTTNQDFTLNLNGQTIFVESASADPQKAIEVGGQCTITGSGCIIAVGDVYFAPDGAVGSENDFVLIMSVQGTTTLQPSGTFYGAVVGDVSVQVQSGEEATITWTDPITTDLDFPRGDVVTGVSIFSWQID